MQLNDKENLYVGPAKSKQEREEDVKKAKYLNKRQSQFLNLYVRGLDLTITPEEVCSYFTQFGTVKSIKVIPNTGIAYVSFLDMEAAKLAKDEPNRDGLRGNKIEVFW